MELKDYQNEVLNKLDYYLQKLGSSKEEAEEYFLFQKSKGRDAKLNDYAKEAWDILVEERRIDFLRDNKGQKIPATYVSRFDGLNRPIPNVCIKVPTGGGKTLLGVSGIERLQMDLFKQQTGMVLWVVPTDTIYKQTWKELANREHPYRQILERASGGRVKLLEKNDAFTRRDVEESLCVMLLMLQSSARKSNETLRMFRDSGRFRSFFPVEDDTEANEKLLSQVCNLDCHDLVDYGWQDGIVPGSVSIKQSLGNVLRIARPIIIIDEGHKAYSETARQTLCGFNPKFILEMSATPNPNGKHYSNVFVTISGQALKDEQMIKLPINLINEEKADWKDTLSLAHEKLKELELDAQQLQNETGRYIRPIMLIRVERTGKDQLHSDFVHAEDVRKYLRDRLGVDDKREVRLKTAEIDELGDEDLLSDTSSVRYIITKDALREGWNCPFAYVLTVLSKMTAKTAITQMIGRVLRQPHARLTNKASLDQCYVYTFDQDVMEAVKGVKQGLEAEGMADVANHVNASNSSDSNIVTTEVIHYRKQFRNLPKIFLPRLLAEDPKSSNGYRLFDYERDILGELDWESITYLGAEKFQLIHSILQRTTARIDYKESESGQGELDLSDPVQEQITFDETKGIDISFIVQQLTDVIPNPWQAMRILEQTLDILRGKGVSDEALFMNRFELVKAMKRDLKQQVYQCSEKIFKNKLDSGVISLRLLASDDSLNWELAQTLEVNVKDGEQILRRKDGSELERSLFEKVYPSKLNDLERDTAWYLDKQKTVYWWHRIAVNQREYSLQGWQKQKVYPDLLVCIKELDTDRYRFSVLETKGEHLKGNDDTEYKRRLFELLTQHAKNAIEAGELQMEVTSEAMSFKILMESNWEQEVVSGIGKVV